MNQRSRTPWRIAAAAFAWLSGTALQAQETPAQPPPVTPAAPSAEAPAPASGSVAEVSARADQLTALLVTIADYLSRPDPDIEKVNAQLPQLANSVQQRLKTLDAERIEPLASVELVAIQRQLRLLSDALEAQRAVLQGVLDRVEPWRATLREASDYFAEVRKPDKARELPDGLRQRIRTLETDIKRTREQLRERLNPVVAAQAEISDLQARLGELRGEIQAALAEQERRLLRINAPPIWALGFEQGAILESLQADVMTSLADASAMPRLAPGGLFGMLVLGVLLIVLARRLRARLAASPRESLSPMTRLVVENPYSVSLLIWALIGPELLVSNLPGLVRGARVLLIVVTLWRLLPCLTAPELLLRLRLLLLLSLAMILERVLLFGEPVSSRLLHIAVAVLGIVLLRQLAALMPAHDRQELAGHRSRRLMVRIGPPALLVGLLGEIIGARALGDQLIGGVVFAIIALLALAAADAILRAAMEVIIDGPGAEWSRAIRRHPGLIRRRSVLVIRFVLVVVFLVALPRLLPVLQVVYEWVGMALNAPLGFGSLNLTLGSIFWFVASIVIALSVARLTRFVLDEDVFSRLPIPTGTGQAASRLIYYALVVGGVVFSIGAAGVELSQLTLLVSALGVGIGFGLQNIVNNFVSGLVIAFERPFREGDMIAVGQLMGRIREIGIRASNIRTIEGAEVIVPNGNLISGEVINWTLSDRSRRIDIPIGVSYGSDPAEVQKVLLEVLNEDPNVAKDPAPVALFKGFGDSSLDFALVFWTPDAEQWVAVASDVRVRIFGALREAGIEIPFPQRDLHIRSSVIGWPAADPSAGS